MNPLLGLLVVLAVQDSVVFEHEDLGLRLSLPLGWSWEEQATGAGPRFEFKVEGDEGLRLSLLAIPKSTVPTPQALRTAIVATVSGADYEGLEQFEVQFADRSAPAIKVRNITSVPPIEARQAYLEHGNSVFICESFVALDALDRWPLEALNQLWSGFELLELSPPVEDPDAALKAMAAKCGSEFDWAESWEQAAARARAEGKPILVYVRIYPGFAFSDDALVGVYMDPRVVELVRRRYVPFKLTDTGAVPFADHALYGLSATTFGTSAMLATPDGRVLAESVGPLYPFLVRGLGLDPALTGPEFEGPKDPLQLAAELLARGEHDLAAGVLDKQRGRRRSAELARLRAELAYRRGDARASLGFLRGVALEHDADSLVDQAVSLMRLGEFGEALALVEDYLEAEPEGGRALEARYWKGALLLKTTGDTQAVAKIWRALAEDHGQDRWGMRAAGSLFSTAFSLGGGARLDWPTPGEVAASASSPAAPLPIEELERVEREALDYLLAIQQPEGCWLHGGSAGTYSRGEPDDLRLAVTAICGSALMEYRDQPRVARALERALAWVLEDHARARRAEAKIYFMDYAVWSRPYALAFMADCVSAGIGDGNELAPVAAEMIADLEVRQRANGGWSYYLTSDLEGASAPEHSISFTTAAVVLGLVRGLDSGFPVPGPMLERALDCLDEMRDAQGNFKYFLGAGFGGASNPVAGAAGRGPACELALLRGGRGQDLDRLESSLRTFVAHREGLMAEQGKALMHCGPNAQGSHYLTFDYSTAAQAIALLPAAEQVKYRPAVLEALLAARGANGGFVDNPLIGWSAGTGLALLAIQSLR
jgi:tetratricopeptide (TPR) repeat protein